MFCIGYGRVLEFLYIYIYICGLMVRIIVCLYCGYNAAHFVICNHSLFLNSGSRLVCLRVRSNEP